MHKVDRYMTRDGTLHTSKRAAADFCEEMCQNMISKLAHKLVAATFKYIAVCDALNDPEFRKSFEEAMRWKDDMFLDKESDDDL